MASRNVKMVPKGPSFSSRWRKNAPTLLIILLAFLAGEYVGDGLGEDKKWWRDVINIMTAHFNLR
jgi:hypothetical protein